MLYQKRCVSALVTAVVENWNSCIEKMFRNMLRGNRASD